MNSETPVFWKSLEELRDESRALAAERRREFLEPLPWQAGAEQHASAHAGPGRRDFLTLMGFSLASATLACARAPVHKAIPFLNPPEELTPGVPLWYATTCGGCSASCGLVVKTRDGRPIKVEGNPDAASFGGGTCAVGQATVLSLYDDARLRGPLWAGRPVTWSEVDRRVEQRLHAAAAGGRRMALVSGTVTSPSTRELIGRMARRYPSLRHVVYEPSSLTALRRAYAECYGRPLVPRHRFDRATLVVGLDADFLGSWLSPVEFTAQYARARRPGPSMARHVQFEPGLSLTGANADMRHAVAASDIGLVALGLLRRVQARADGAAPHDAPGVASLDARALDAVADELWRARGRSLVVSGAADVATQVLIAALNHALGNVGHTLDLARPSLQKQADDGEMTDLVAEMSRGEVHVALFYGVNPAYDYVDPPGFARALERVALSVSFAGTLDETAALTHAVCPDHHFLEAWGDAEPVTGEVTLAQPTIAPLFDTRSAQESLLTWSGETPDYHAYLRAFWRRNLHAPLDDAGFESFWDQSLQAGRLANRAVHAVHLEFAGDVDAAARRVARGHGEAAEDYELHLNETLALRDGRHANNPWLQELPDPVTKLTWGNAAAVSIELATRLGVEDGDVVTLESGAHRIELPVCVQPGQAAATVSVAVGYGRTAAGKVGTGVGANAFPFAAIVDGVRSRRARVRVARTGRRERLATTQTHHSMEGRSIVRTADLAAYLANSAAGNEAEPEPPTLWAEHAPGLHSWSLAIDLSACTGCSACVVACQAENNVPVVGRDEVARGREMHWIRIDRYYAGPPEHPETVFQPVMCQHCADAPCETVCPVLATVHSSDGLNQQVYNRCIGTRYCENNCPYKVRRFNWWSYAHNPRFDFHMNSPLGEMVLNPDVVVRSRGVMEKCSLCIQRIQAGKLDAKLKGRSLADGAIVTACQQACPTQAIVFGDAADPASRAAQNARDPRGYRLLGGLGTRPAVSYLTRIRRTET